MTVINKTQKNNSDDLKERLVALTRDLILIPSTSSKPEERQRCHEFIKNHLESLEHISIREFEYKGFPSLVATAPGCVKPDILLCGHQDVITHSNLVIYRSHIKEGRIYGPGAGDMKGALAVLLEVFRSVHTLRPRASLGIVITSDEETGGEAGINYLFCKQKLNCSRAMIPDGGSLNQITVEEKGILHLRIVCSGRCAHAARPWLGENPIEYLMEGLRKLRIYFDGLAKDGNHWFPTYAVTVIGTENQTTNRIPREANAILDIRFPPPLSVNKLFTYIKEILGKEVGVEIIISAEPSHLSPDALYQQIIEEVTGTKAAFVLDDAGSDARYFASRGIPVMMSRPLVGNLHAEEEWIDIDSMVLLYKIYERYLLSKLKT